MRSWIEGERNLNKPKPDFGSFDPSKLNIDAGSFFDQLKPGYGSEMHTMQLGNAGGSALDAYQQGQQTGVPGMPLLPYTDETHGGGPWVNYASAQGGNYPPGLLQALQNGKQPGPMKPFGPTGQVGY
jgi:hypothetical protein